jgi:phosphoglucomutase
MSNLLADVRLKAQKWLGHEYDSETQNQVQHLIDHDENELIECFYRNLEFGTGGLRGIMGVGTNRMNVYTVGMATQGLSNYLKMNFGHLPEIKVVVAHDSRNNGRLFAETTARIFAANGFRVYLFDTLRPTPELSFAIRYFGCQSGVVLTASHNPKEYNGYKAYWDDGGQVIEPHDKNIIAEVEKIQDFSEVLFEGNSQNIIPLGDDFDQIYIDRICALSLSPEAVKRMNNMKIVYTPLHGTGVDLVPAVLEKMGFANVIHIPEQDVPDGNFPTLHSPNPEESAALDMAIRKAIAENADLVLATDPDADRVGIAVRNTRGEFVLLNGNQTASVLIYYILRKWTENGKLSGNEFIVKTIVTSELLALIAEKFKVECFDVLTGFKYIADIIRKLEGTKTFIAGGEESYGYLVGDFVRDKDAISSCAMIAEAAAWAADSGKSFYELLLDIYVEFGLFHESLVSITRKGKAGVEEIQAMMEGFRNSPPESINGEQVMMMHDYEKQVSFDLISQLRHTIELPRSNVIQFLLADGSKISIRPSGTEPKIKFYFGVKGKLESRDLYETTRRKLEEKIAGILKSLNL